MNILSITQLKGQTPQTELSQLQPQPEKTAKSSFEDFLRSAQAEEHREPEKNPADNSVAKSEKADDVSVGQKSEQIARKDERSEKNQIEENKKETSGNDKSEKIARQSSDEKKVSEKTGQTVEDVTAEIAVSEISIENFQLMQLLEKENLNSDEVIAFSEVEVPNLVLGEENSEIDDKTLAWLMSSARRESLQEDISSEDLDSLMDAATEFIPGSESESEKLENAQNLAVSDPELFLEAADSARFAEMQRGAVKSEFTLGSDNKTTLTIDSAEKKKGAKITIHDLRSRHLFDDTSAKVDSSKIVQKAAEKKEITLSLQQQNENNVQMTMELAAKAQENITSSSAQAAGANGSDFQAMLSNAVQENAPDFVKAGNIVLKDSNQGTINLILRPEGLGNVKISLNLDDKNLSAQITVQTKEAMDAFRESISSLKQAFAESGFETGSFDLNFSNNQNQQGFAQSGEQEQNQQNIGILAQKSYGEFVTADALASGEMAETSSEGRYAINIVA
ncbi:MAG: flagellar hook-length control protein FliK [Treponema sp.]|nr:flagellar hook-length control protein FliK [Treponema sp.]